MKDEQPIVTHAKSSDGPVKMPNAFKIGWWCFLIIMLTSFMVTRYRDLASGHAAGTDVVAFVIWIALLLVPLFNEVSILGITLKQQVDELKGLVKQEIGTIRGEIRNANDFRPTYNPQIILPPADAQLPALEKTIRDVLADEMAKHGSLVPAARDGRLTLPENVELLFATRYHIEKEMRRIAEGLQLNEPGRLVPIMRLLRSFVDAGLINEELALAIRETYAVCSTAIHGAPATEAQVKFASDVGPDIIAALGTINPL